MREFHLHMQNIERSVPYFSGRFVNEAGSDIVRILHIPKDNEFEGFFVDDHMSQMTVGAPWGHRGQYFSTGYLRGLFRGFESAEEVG